MTTTVLAVSPHLDDAVFSAGGTLARRIREGCRVVVATVFTASVPDPVGFALACQLDKGLSAELDYMALRRGEDAAACTILGVEPIWMPFTEAPHRGYHSATELFEPVHGDDRIVEAVAPALAKLVRELRPTEIWGPQAIGAHVDHVIVREALARLRQPLCLWADFPYTMRAAAAQDGRKPEWGQRLPPEPADLDRKIEAAVAYKSQLGFQFGGESAARRTLASHGSAEFVQVVGTGQDAIAERLI